MILCGNAKAQWTVNGTHIYNSNTGKVGIGIGATTPAGMLTVKGSGSVPAASWVNSGVPISVGFGEQTVGNADYIVAQASTVVNARPVFVGRRSRGTLALPAVVVNNDNLSSLLASGYDGSAFQNPATIDFFVDGVPSFGNIPARISFVTGTNSTNRTERLKIGSTGNISFNGNQLYLDNSTGNIGIGTIASTGPYKLAVEGKIGAREIKVTLANPWADYVFDENYNLRSLYDLDSYIKQNNHLPGIPSASEVKLAGGVELGNMNVKLLEKIEELTLYLISLKKENDEIKKQIIELQNKSFREEAS